jgi:hypothetical protein
MEKQVTSNTHETDKFHDRLTSLEDRLKTIERSNLALNQTVQSLRDTYLKMSVIFSLATAAVTAIVVKFFVG